MKVLVTPVTSCWGTVTVAGPRAWQWLQGCGLEAALAPGSMPHMTLRESVWEGLPLRVLRASFSGELGYEVNLPVRHAEALLGRLWAQVDLVGGALYGIQALEVLRTEKGYLHVGTDTDGTTQPQDVGFARGIARKAANFTGRRSLLRPASLDPGRPQLVGLKPLDQRTLLPVGAQIAKSAPPALSEGRVTSACFSPELGFPVALALLNGGFGRLGETVRVYHLGRTIEAQVVKTPFLDPEGVRVHG